MNAAWAGQWDMKEIMISMGNHVTTDNLKLGGEFTVAFATKKTMVASDFVKQGFIRETAVEGRKRSYVITDTGNRLLQEEYVRLKQLVNDYDNICGRK